MGNYLLRRLAISVPVLLGITLMVYVVISLAPGDPVDALVAAASETNADLIVVGARGRSFPARTLRGAVAQRLVGRAPCPVLVAR